MTSRHLLRQQCPAGSVPYIIRLGDTLYKIARFFNATIANIINANPGINPNVLMVGQQICVPQTVQLYPSCSTTNYYVVRIGDTLQSIANYFNVSYYQLLYSNYGIIPDYLYEDQVLCIPVAPSPVILDANIGNRTLTVFYNGNVFRSYTISVENPAFPVPRGTFTVINKNVDPGVERGARWLGFNVAEFGIRGTNEPEFIKELSTGNSIVMTNQDVSELFNLVPVGTIVQVS